MATRRAFPPMFRSCSATILRSRPTAIRNHIVPAPQALPTSCSPLLRQPYRVRWSSSAPSAEPISYDFEHIKSLSEDPSKERILIDVREPNELQTTGHIPTAVNMPLKSHPDGIFLSRDEFAEQFGFSKPGPDQELIFYCKSGVRSKAAARLALQGGYERVGNYGGSWLDWDSKGGKKDKV